MRFFRGSHFVLVGENVDFLIFYFGIGSAYPELPIQVEVKFRLFIKMGALGAPRPPAHNNFKSEYDAVPRTW